MQQKIYAVDDKPTADLNRNPFKCPCVNVPASINKLDLLADSDFVTPMGDITKLIARQFAFLTTSLVVANLWLEFSGGHFPLPGVNTWAGSFKKWSGSELGLPVVFCAGYDVARTVQPQQKNL